MPERAPQVRSASKRGGVWARLRGRGLLVLGVRAGNRPAVIVAGRRRAALASALRAGPVQRLLETLLTTSAVRREEGPSDLPTGKRAAARKTAASRIQGAPRASDQRTRARTGGLGSIRQVTPRGAPGRVPALTWPRPSTPQVITAGVESHGQLLERRKPAQPTAAQPTATHPTAAAAQAQPAQAQSRPGNQRRWSARDLVRKRIHAPKAELEADDLSQDELSQEEVRGESRERAGVSSPTRRRRRDPQPTPARIAALNQREMLAVLQTLAVSSPEARELLRDVAAQLDELRTQTRLRRLT